MADVAKNWKIWWDGYDLSADFNALAIATEVAKERATVFGSTAHVDEPSLPENMVEFGGLWRADTDVLDDVLHSRLGVTGGVFTVSPTGLEDAVALFCRVSQGRYQRQGVVGRLLRFDGSVFQTTGDPLVRGTVLTPNDSKASSDVSTALQVGAVSASQYLYAVLHVFSGTGTLDVVVQSDNAEGFSSPTGRITFAQATGREAQYATRVAGSITDDWWRVSYTIATGPFAFAVAIGIL